MKQKRLAQPNELAGSFENKSDADEQLGKQKRLLMATETAFREEKVSIILIIEN